MNTYFLSNDAYVCVLGDQLVLLHLSSGKYFGLAHTQARSLSNRVRDWPLAADGQTDNEAETLLGRLQQQGLLTTDCSCGKPAIPVSLKMPTLAVADRRVTRSAQIRLRHLLRFAISVLYAAIALRWVPFGRLMRHIARRKSAHSNARSSDIDVVAELVLIFNLLRPFAYSKKDACLLHSFALTEFLARHDVFPDWVFGVRSRPFEAHCWVQMGEYALSQGAGSLECLTPIFVI